MANRTPGSHRAQRTLLRADDSVLSSKVITLAHKVTITGYAARRLEHRLDISFREG